MTNGFIPYKTDLIVMCKITYGGIIPLTIYVDDILLRGIDEAGISTTNAYFFQRFMMWDLQTPRYIHGIVFSYETSTLSLS